MEPSRPSRSSRRAGPAGVVLALCAACGAPAPAPQAPAPVAAAVDPELAPVARTWIVAEHVLARGASLSPADAKGYEGRTLDVGARSFMSPWQGTCEGTAPTRQPRTLAEVLTELGVEGGARTVVEGFGLGEEVTEYRLACAERPKAPPLTLYVGNERAMTCFGGGCYLMTPF